MLGNPLRVVRRALKVSSRYDNPYRHVSNLLFNGYDQGIDFDGSGVVYAIGPAVVTFVSNHSGWPGGGAVSYRFTSGKAAGKTVYFAENITPLVRWGQTVTADTPIAAMHNAYPYTESGWAHDNSDDPLSQPISHGPTFFGVNYGRFLRSVGCRAAPLESGGSDTPLPVGWPQWL